MGDKKIVVKQKSKKFVEEFKEFALKGNVMDMAVGVIIGAAFGNIVTAFTKDIINPLINSIGGTEIAGVIKLPWVDYTGLDAETAQTLVINWGDLVTAIINFLIMALCIFLMVKAVNKLMDKAKKDTTEENVEDIEEAVNDEVKLLEEIRNLLKKKK